MQRSSVIKTLLESMQKNGLEANLPWEITFLFNIYCENVETSASPINHRRSETSKKQKTELSRIIFPILDLHGRLVDCSEDIALQGWFVGLLLLLFFFMCHVQAKNSFFVVQRWLSDSGLSLQHTALCTDTQKIKSDALLHLHQKCKSDCSLNRKVNHLPTSAELYYLATCSSD